MAGTRTRRAKPGARSTSRLGDQTRVAEEVALRQLEVAPQREVGTRGSKLMAGLLIAFGMAMLFAFLSGSRFMVSQVRIEGAHLTIPDEVRQAANVDYANIFQIDAKRLEQHLVTELGCVAQAKVRCRLPNQVEIALTEYDASAVWESVGGYWWVDESGKVLGRASDPGPRVVIHDTQGLFDEPSGYIIGVPWEMVTALSSALPAAKELDYSQSLGLVVWVTANRWPVYLGHSGDAERKVSIMQDLVDRLTREGLSIAYIDLRDEQRPTFKAH